MSDLFYPKSGSLRGPTENSKNHGQVVNPPRMAEFGGMSSTKKGPKKNDKSIKKPGIR